MQSATTIFFITFYPPPFEVRKADWNFISKPELRSTFIAIAAV
jgi:hypothetical protein